VRRSEAVVLQVEIVHDLTHSTPLIEDASKMVACPPEGIHLGPKPLEAPKPKPHDDNGLRAVRSLRDRFDEHVRRQSPVGSDQSQSGVEGVLPTDGGHWDRRLLTGTGSC